MEGYFTSTNRDEYLQHFGIPKMKWGVRNGPPYPLDKSDYSAAEKKAAGISPKKSNNGSNKKESVSERAKKMSDEELKKDNSRKVLENQYVKNHKDDDPDAIDKAWKTTENAKNTIKSAKDMVDIVDRKTKRTESTSDIDISKLDDKELQRIVNRMNLEAQYNRMTTKEVSDKGVEFARETLEVAGSLVGIAGGVVMIMKGLRG